MGKQFDYDSWAKFQPKRFKRVAKLEKLSDRQFYGLVGILRVVFDYKYKPYRFPSVALAESIRVNLKKESHGRVSDL